jgi:hypothetical protein
MAGVDKKRAHAERMAQAIRQFWAERGAFPEVWLEHEFISMQNGHNSGRVWKIRSDMVNGKPKNLRVQGNYEWERHRWK